MKVSASTSMIPFLSLPLFTAISGAASTSAQNTSSTPNITLVAALPASLPANASPAVSPNFQAFAFEIASFAQYAQTTANDSTPNNFTLNMMRSITERTGGHPIIRIGGTSAEYALYNPGQSFPVYPVEEINNVQATPGTLLGPSFFPLTRNFDSLNASFILQFPLAPNNLSEPAAWAAAAIPAVGWDRIDALELGNEANLYGQSPKVNGTVIGPPGWSATLSNETYAQRYLNHSAALLSSLQSEGIALPNRFTNGTGLFQVLDTAYPLSPGDPIFGVQPVFDAGINKAGIVKQVAWHYYQTATGNYSTLARDLMNHTAIALHLDAFRPYITYLSSLSPPIPFTLSEVGNSLDKPRDTSYQASLGSALWQIDFQLYAASIGVARIHWQQIMRAAYGLWLPRASGGYPAQPFAPFYAMPFVGDFLGKSNGTTQVTQLHLNHTVSAGPMNQTDTDGIVAYAAWQGGQVRRVAVINFNVWDNPTANTTQANSTAVGQHRPFARITLSGLGTSPRNISLTGMSSPDGAHANASTINYGGLQWSAQSGGRAQAVNTTGVYKQTAQQKGDHLTLAISASSAVLLDLYASGN